MRWARVTTSGLAGLGAGSLALAWAIGRRRRPDADADPPDPPGLPPARTVTIPGRGELFLRDQPGPHAEAPTVLLLHGWMFPADLNWARSYAPLAAEARVLAPDHRGHGRGPRHRQPFRLIDVADDCAALIRELGTGPVIPVGYSMGGPIAQLLWQRHPDVVRGVVLCATGATFPETPLARYRWGLLGPAQVGLRLLSRGLWERLLLAQASGRLPRTVSRMVDEDTPADVVAMLPWAVGELSRGDPEDLAEAGREVGVFDSRGWVQAMDVPAAVLITGEDRLVSPDRQRELADLLPGATRVDTSLDHDGCLIAPEAFVPALLEAVRAVDHQAAPRGDVAAAR